MYGYDCPCGIRLEDADQRTLTEQAWAHAGSCDHEAHTLARAADQTYGHPDHFHFDDGSVS